MGADPGDRTRYWRAIEKKHGHDMAYWFDTMKTRDGQGYSEQMAFLQKQHGFSRTHANALVMYSRGSVSPKRFEGLDGYVAGIPDPKVSATLQDVLGVMTRAYADLHVVIAWNQPMLKAGDAYVFAVSAAKAHLLLAPWSGEVLERFRPRLEADGYTVNKKTFRVPGDWQVDAALLRDMVGAVIERLGTG